jgi:phosphoglycolate phosphatase-like HAD superfamily hydrolase
MKFLKEFKNIFWDFDGVLMNSNAIRDEGFIRVLSSYPKDLVESLLDFHRQNGGLSRYVKFRFFIEKVLREEATDERIQQFASSFSDIMKELLVDTELLIQDSLNHVKESYRECNMHIVSGSDQNELVYLCERLGIALYFKSIHGSPTPKIQLIETLILENHYEASDCILVGDSVNDLEAARRNNIAFAGYNNPQLKQEAYYINDFNS